MSGMRLRFLLIMLLGILSINNAFATHIVGGEITYRCLGPAGANLVNYEIEVTIYQDCMTGDPMAIAEDVPAFIKIFENGNSVLFDSIPQPETLLVPPNFNNNCVKNPPTTCLRRARFVRTYTLSANTAYTVVYQRCCRNQSINNIINPGAVGASYFCEIPASSQVGCNSSAVFNNYPPQIVCINNPLVYDHSATDADGDSLSYEFCEAYVGGSTNDAKPIPSPPPYTAVNYAGNYSAAQPMAGFPLVQINPTTGIISGTPNIIGRFVVTVCCHEWRNGVIINTVKREFQFVVTNCSKAVVADIPQFSEEFNTYIVQCSGLTVTFLNQSSGANFSDPNRYSWDFGVPNVTTDVSNDSMPTFTYPDTGTYIVSLVVNRGSTCPDSIARIVKVYPNFKTDFFYSGLQCPESPIQFFDSTVATYQPINKWTWNFGDGLTSDVQDPEHSYDVGGEYDVSLISQNSKGCVDTAIEQLYIDPFVPFAGNDTIIVKGEYINFNATGGSIYNWVPATYLNNPNINNPVGFYPDPDTVTYVVRIESDFGCFGFDTVAVKVVGQASIFVPTGFSPNGDGRNETLRPIGIGYRDINGFRVYNRWGEQVFYTTKFDEGWDGTWKGQKAEIGVYYWFLEITDRKGNRSLVKGNSTLVR